MFLCSRFASLLLFAVCSCVISNHVSGEQTDYCKITSCAPGQHTMCLYNSATPSSLCAKYNASGSLTENDILAIVGEHNKLRERVATGQETLGNPGPQPPASNMKILKWDQELAKVAQRYADQCLDGHDKCRDVERFGVGQNIATLWSTARITQSLEKFVQMWYDEVSKFDKNGVSQYRFVPSTGHYTALVWAATSYVGCGRALYYDTTHKMNAMRLICNYAPAGNFIGRPVYQIGKAGTACPSGISSSSSNLCN